MFLRVVFGLFICKPLRITPGCLQYKSPESNVTVTQEFITAENSALIAQDSSQNAGHFRGCWKCFSLLGKQSGLRTDFSLLLLQQSHRLQPRLPLFASSPTFSHSNTIPPPKMHQKKDPAFSTHYHPISLYTGPCRPVSSVKHPQPPLLFSFCLLYCNHFAGPETCGCAGSHTKTRGREKEKLHGN